MVSTLSVSSLRIYVELVELRLFVVAIVLTSAVDRKSVKICNFKLIAVLIKTVRNKYNM